VPSRSDLFRLGSELFQKAGVVTVMRGNHYPDDDGLPANAYPLVAWVEGAPLSQPSRLNPQGNYAFDIEGRISCTLWIYTASVQDARLGDAGWSLMDDLHDAVLRQFAVYFAGDAASGGNTSNTTVFEPDTFEPFYWYIGKNPIIGAELMLKYRLAFA
jgi:hypothetical protein